MFQKYNNLYKNETLILINMNIYLNVPYCDKNLAKQYGAKFDFEKKLWYIPPNISHINKQNLLNRWKLKEVNLIGEDRKYGVIIYL